MSRNEGSGRSLSRVPVPLSAATRAMVNPNSSHELNDDALADDIVLLADVLVAATAVE